MEWHFAQGEAVRGPVDDDTLRALIRDGVVVKETPIWSPALDAWKAAGSVVGVAHLFQRPGPVLIRERSARVTVDGADRALPPVEVRQLLGGPGGSAEVLQRSDQAKVAAQASRTTRFASSPELRIALWTAVIASSVTAVIFLLTRALR